MTLAADLPLFDPVDAGLPDRSWDELRAAAVAAKPKCRECDRPLRSKESQEAVLRSQDRPGRRRATPQD